MAVQAKNLTVSVTLVISIVLAMGTTIVNLMEKSSEQAISQLQSSHEASIYELKEEIQELKDSDVVLHGRISDVSERQRGLETNLAGYNAKLDNLQSDLREIKSDMKELTRVDFSAAIRNALREINQP